MKKIGIAFALLSVLIFASAGLLYIPELMGYSSIAVLDYEMEGEIKKGDLAFLKEYDGHSLKEGEIIGISHNDESKLRRVVRIKPLSSKIITKGDGNELIDEEFLLLRDVIGVYSFSFMLLGYLKAFISSLLGKITYFSLMVLLPTLSIVLITSSPKNKKQKSKKQIHQEESRLTLSKASPSSPPSETKSRFNFDE